MHFMRWTCLLLAVTAFAQTRGAIEQQLKSVEQQREMTRAMLPPLRAPEPAPPECDPMPDDQVTPLIESAAKERQLPAKLLRAVIEQESAFRACAVSDSGAQGLMQIMPATAEQYKVRDAFDPKENISAGSALLRALLEKYKGDLPLALAAYNAGPQAVDPIVKGPVDPYLKPPVAPSGKVPDIPETRAYVTAIVDKLQTKRIELTPIPVEPAKAVSAAPNR
jgi:soluble lytic murein transglycosylase-like protein